MSNPFDQFDEAESSPPTNPFDQFDTSAEAVATVETNAFDKFDEPAPALAENDTGIPGDFAASVGQGFTSAIKGDVKIADLAIGGTDATASALAWLKDKEDSLSIYKSAEQKASESKKFFEDNGDMGDAWTDPRAYMNLLGSGVGSLAAIIATGGPIKGIISKAASKAVLKGEGKSVLHREAAKRNIDTAAGMAGFGIAEGAMVSGGTADQIEEEILKMDQAILDQSPLYNEFLNETGDAESARTSLARQMGIEGAKSVAIPSVLLGSVAGHFLNNAITGRMTSSRLANAAILGGVEMPTEAAQGAYEQYTQNKEVGVVDPGIDPMRGVANAATMEGLGGGLAGGALGLVTNRPDSPLPVEELSNEETAGLYDDDPLVESPIDQQQANEIDIETKQTPESYQDLNAQALAVHDGRKPALLVTEGAEVPEGAYGLQSVDVPNYGTLYTNQKVSKGKLGGMPILNEDGSMNGQVLGYASSIKPVDDSGVVTEGVDANGNIVHQEIGQSEEAAQAAMQVAGEGGQVRVIPTEKALQEREQRRIDDLSSLEQPTDNVDIHLQRQKRLAVIRQQQEAEQQAIRQQEVEQATAIVAKYDKAIATGFQMNEQAAAEYEQAQVTIEGSQGMLNRQVQGVADLLKAETPGDVISGQKQAQHGLPSPEQPTPSYRDAVYQRQDEVVKGQLIEEKTTVKEQFDSQETQTQPEAAKNKAIKPDISPPDTPKPTQQTETTASNTEAVSVSEEPLKLERNDKGSLIASGTGVRDVLKAAGVKFVPRKSGTALIGKSNEAAAEKAINALSPESLNKKATASQKATENANKRLTPDADRDSLVVFLAKHGGIRDSEAHDLARTLEGISTPVGIPNLVNKNGMALAKAWDKANEAGYAVGDKDTDMINVLGGNDIYTDAGYDHQVDKQMAEAEDTQKHNDAIAIEELGGEAYIKHAASLSDAYLDNIEEAAEHGGYIFIDGDMLPSQARSLDDLQKEDATNETVNGSTEEGQRTDGRASEASGGSDGQNNSAENRGNLPRQEESLTLTAEPSKAGKAKKKPTPQDNLFELDKPKVSDDLISGGDQSIKGGSLLDVAGRESAKKQTSIEDSERSTKPVAEPETDSVSNNDHIVEANKKVGDFGTIHAEFKHDAKGAIAKLRENKGGEAVAALSHPEIGDIDLVWGKEGTGKGDGFGLSKLIKFHPEVVDDLQSVIESMTVVSKTNNRIQIESGEHKGTISLEWFGKGKTWLLTSYEKRAGVRHSMDTSSVTSEGGKLSSQPAHDAASIAQSEKTAKQPASPKKETKPLPEGVSPQVVRNLEINVSAAESEVNQQQKEMDRLNESDNIPGSFVAGRSNYKMGKQRDAMNNKLSDQYNKVVAAEKDLKQAKQLLASYKSGETHENGQPKANSPSKAAYKEAEKVSKQAALKLPIVNDPDNGYEVAAELWRKASKDYKSILVSDDGKYRYRSMMMMVDGATTITPVYLKDKKVVKVPTIEASTPEKAAKKTALPDKGDESLPEHPNKSQKNRKARLQLPGMLNQSDPSVNSNEKNDASKPEGGGTHLYSKEDAAKFSDDVDAFVSGSLGRYKLLNVGKTPGVLQMVGAEDLPVTMSQKVANKVINDKHILPADTLKQIPKAIADPIMVFSSATQKNSMVVMTELKHDGKTVIATLHLNVENGGVQVNAIGSVYSKDRNNFFKRQVEDGRLLYANMKKSRKWFQFARLQLPRALNQSDSEANYSTEADLSKFDQVGALTTAEAEAELRKDRHLAKMLDKGKLQIMSDEGDSKGKLHSVGKKFKGVYHLDKAYVIAKENTRKGISATAWHELTHASMDIDGFAPDFLGKKKHAKLMKQLSNIYRTASKTSGSVNKFFQAAFDRIPADTREEHLLDELAGYAVEGYVNDAQSAPQSVAKWVREFIAAVKIALYRHTGVLIGKLKPQDLLAISKAYASFESNKRTVAKKKKNKNNAPLFSDGSVVYGDGNESGMSVQSVQKVADEFVSSYNGNIPLRVIVRQTQEDLYGPKGSIEKEGVIKGAYLPRAGVLLIAASSQSSVRDARETLRHEILGHYGLNTFNPADKRTILDKILASRNEPSLKVIWEKIEKDYSDKSEDVKAEEVFADIATKQPSGVKDFFDSILALINKALRSVGLSKGPTSRSELRRLVISISKGIKNGSRTQQNFPEGDDALFRKTSEATVKEEAKAIKKESKSIANTIKHSGTADVAMSFAKWMYFSPTQIVRDFGVPATKQISDMFYKDASHENRVLDGLDMVQREQERKGHFFKRIEGLMEGLPKRYKSKGFQKILVDALNGDNVALSVLEDAKPFKKLLDELGDYMAEAGIEVNRLKDYFPRVYDVKELRKNKEVFIDLVDKQGMNGEQVYMNIVENDGMFQNFSDHHIELNEDGKVIKKAGKRYNKRVGNARKGSFEKGRVIDVPYADLKQFLVREIEPVLGRHISSVVKRSEYARVAGVNNSKLEALAVEAVKQYDKLPRSEKFADMNDLIESINFLSDRMQGKQEAMHPGVRRLSQTARNFSVMAHLGMVLLASIPETMMPYVKLGNGANFTKHLFKGFAEAMREGTATVLKATTGNRMIPKSQMRELTERLGVASQSGMEQAFQQRFGGVSSKMTNAFMKMTMLEQLTNVQRMISFGMAQDHISQLAKKVGNSKGKDRAQFVMELKDFGLDPAAAAKWAADGFSKSDPFYENVNMGAQRFAQQVITTPIGATLPRIMSNPIGQVMFQFKSFTSVHSNTFLKKLLVDMARYPRMRDKVRPIIPILIMVSVAYAVQFLREAWKYDDREDVYLMEEDHWKRVVAAIDRSGMTGDGTAYMNMMMPYRYGYGDWARRFYNLAGPLAGDATRIAGALTAEDKPKKIAKTVVGLTPVLNVTPHVRVSAKEALEDVLY